MYQILIYCGDDYEMLVLRQMWILSGDELRTEVIDSDHVMQVIMYLVSENGMH